MILYHGSNTTGITTLEPRLADHGRPYVYLATVREIALLYLCNAVERPYYWFPYGFTKEMLEKGDLRPIYTEYWEEMVEDCAKGKRGCIYTVDVSSAQVAPLRDYKHAFLATQEVPVTSCEEIPDAYDEILRCVEEGKMFLQRYDQLSDAAREGQKRSLIAELREKNMIETPEDPYARLIREKMPKVWERYVSEASEG